MVARGNHVLSLIVHCRAPSAPLGVEALVVQSLTAGLATSTSDGCPPSAGVERGSSLGVRGARGAVG